MEKYKQLKDLDHLGDKQPWNVGFTSFNEQILTLRISQTELGA